MDFCRQIPASTPRLEGNSWENYYHELLPINDFPTIFQCGILLIDVEAWRQKDDHWHLLKKAAGRSFPGGADQDLLNLHFKGRIGELTQEYNFVNHSESVISLIEKLSSVENATRVKDWRNISKPKVVHFTGAYLPKPFDTISHFPYSLEYWRFAKQSIFSPILDGRIQSIAASKLQGQFPNLKQSNSSLSIRRILFPILFSIYIKSPNWLRKNKLISKPKGFLRRRLL
jgi:lipopolysaccharide biosynthesis glycosyltransferase